MQHGKESPVLIRGKGQGYAAEKTNMPSIVKNIDAERCLRSILQKEGYELSPERGYGETGVDVIARHGTGIFYIEVIGYKKSGPARAKDFYESFFRAVSRIKAGARRCVIALPINAKRGLPARANHYGEAWIRIGRAFPELEIWFIDVERNMIERSTWNQWGSQQHAGEGPGK